MSESSLTDFVASVCKESHLRVETDLGDGFVRLLIEEAERRQAAHDIRSTEDALIELLRNSRDAHARLIFIASSKTEDTRTITVIDDGDGIPDHMHELIFEPRVTSKLDSIHTDKWGVHGRGMALYSVRMNTMEARVCASAPQKGTAIRTVYNLRTIAEKHDQSTFPQFMLNEASTVTVRGPKNLLRTACEFTLEHRDSVLVFMGGSVDIAATLFAYGEGTLSLMDRAFAHGTDDIPLVKRLALAPDEETFCECAKQLGLSLSERSARRILDGEIKPLAPLFETIQDMLLAQMKPAAKPAAKHSSKKQSAESVHFTKAEFAALTKDVQQSFGQLADAYYLRRNVDISAKISQGELVIRIPLVSKD